MDARELLQWTRDRLANCELIAAHKSGSDRAGWLDDASHFERIIAALSTPAPLREPPRTPTPEMIEAGGKADVDWDCGPWRDNLRAWWQAMYDAAPAEPIAQQPAPLTPIEKLAQEWIVADRESHDRTIVGPTCRLLCAEAAIRDYLADTPAPQPIRDLSHTIPPADDLWPHAWWIKASSLAAMHALKRFGTLEDTVIAQAEQTWPLLARIESDAAHIRAIEKLYKEWKRHSTEVCTHYSTEVER